MKSLVPSRGSRTQIQSVLLSKIFEETHLVQLADADAIELAKTSKDFQVRIKKLNQSLLIIIVGWEN